MSSASSWRAHNCPPPRPLRNPSLRLSSRAGTFRPLDMLHDHTELIEPWIGLGLMLALVRGREAAQEFTDRGSNRPPLVATSFGSSATAETPRPEHRRAL